MAIADFNKPQQGPNVASPRPVRHTDRTREPGADPAAETDPNAEDRSLLDDENGLEKVAGLQADLTAARTTGDDARPGGLGVEGESDADGDGPAEDDEDEDDEDEFDDDDDEDEEDGDEASDEEL